MIEGIEILSQKTLYTMDAWSSIGLMFIFFGMICLIGTISLFFDKKYTDWTGTIVFLILTIILSLMAYGCLSLSGGPEPYQQYKVLISDTVKLKEFTEKYAIINQVGKVYTIIEKVKEP